MRIWQTKSKLILRSNNLTNQTQETKKQVRFENMRNISEINNVHLVKMSKEVDSLRHELEQLTKSVRFKMRDIENAAAEKEAATDAAAARKIESSVTKVEQKLVREGNRVQTQPQNREARPARDNSRPQQNQQGQRQDRPFNRQFDRNKQGDNQGQFQRRQGQNQYQNQGQGQRPFGQRNNQNGNNQNRTDRNNGQQRDRDGFKKPFGDRKDGARPAGGGRRESNEPLVNINDLQNNVNKRSFDNKRKDNKQHKGSGFDDFGRNQKRNMMRRGMLEESNIEERIRSNRKTKKKKEENIVVAAPIDHAIITTENITVKQLSEKTGRSVAEILKQLMVLGMMSNVNSSIDFTTAELVSSELGVVLEQKLEKSYEEQLAEEFGVSSDHIDDKNSVARPPIVTVLGHVDHGKTSLLDFIRKTHIQSQEAGGITQHIAAYQIKTMDRLITFIDTPGHEAFSAMRARGASVTDIAILVVAGDDGVKPQTLEAVQHIKQAKIPMIVAVNKMDKAEFNIERVKQQLAEVDVVPEEWGGDTIFVPISALTGQNIDKLLEMVLLVADMRELKANPDTHALGMVIEAKLDKGKGPIATAIILNGTLKVGDYIISGVHTGKVRALIDDKGKNIRKALPSTPISVLGLDGVPNAGDQLYAVDAKFSKDVLAERKRKIQQDKINSKNAFSMEEFLAKSADSEKKVLNLIVKTDVQGSFEALVPILNSINNEEVRVECIHGGVGAINENDVIMAKNANAIIIGFNTKTDSKAGIMADHDKVKIFMSKIIYQVSDFVSTTIKGMRTPIFEEKVIGHGEVIRTFKISRIGTIAGCIVKDGKISKNAKIRLYRDGKMLVDTTITTLQRNKEDVKEVMAGMDCGMKLEGHNDIQLEDTIEAYVMVEIKRD